MSEETRNLAADARERLTATEPSDAMALGPEVTPPGKEAPATRRGSASEPRLKLVTDCDERGWLKYSFTVHAKHMASTVPSGGRNGIEAVLLALMKVNDKDIKDG